MGFAPMPVLSIVAGLLLGFVFVRRQLALESPIIDVRLFRIRAFSASLGTYFLGIFVVVGYFLFIAQYLQLVLGLSPLEAALWSLPSAVGLHRRLDYRAADHPSLPPFGDHGSRHGDRRGRHRDAPRALRRRRWEPAAHRRRVGRDLDRTGAGDHARHGAHRGQRAARAGRRRHRNLGDERRAGRARWGSRSSAASASRSYRTELDRARSRPRSRARWRMRRATRSAGRSRSPRRFPASSARVLVAAAQIGVRRRTPLRRRRRRHPCGRDGHHRVSGALEGAGSVRAAVGRRTWPGRDRGHGLDRPMSSRGHWLRYCGERCETRTGPMEE